MTPGHRRQRKSHTCYTHALKLTLVEVTTAVDVVVVTAAVVVVTVVVSSEKKIELTGL